jgi:hypothetical protein
MFGTYPLFQFPAVPQTVVNAPVHVSVDAPNTHEALFPVESCEVVAVIVFTLRLLSLMSANVTLPPPLFTRSHALPFVDDFRYTRFAIPAEPVTVSVPPIVVVVVAVKVTVCPAVVSFRLLKLFPDTTA